MIEQWSPVSRRSPRSAGPDPLSVPCEAVTDYGSAESDEAARAYPSLDGEPAG